MGPDDMILVFGMLSFKPTFSLPSFTFIKRVFSSPLLLPLEVVMAVASSAYLRRATGYLHKGPVPMHASQDCRLYSSPHVRPLPAPASVENLRIRVRLASAQNFEAAVFLSHSLLCSSPFILKIVQEVKSPSLVLGDNQSTDRPVFHSKSSETIHFLVFSSFWRPSGLTKAETSATATSSSLYLLRFIKPLLNFSKSQIFVLWIVSIVFLFSVSLIAALICIISFPLL